MTLVPRAGATPYGDLTPLVPMFEAEIAVNEAAGTARLQEFARSLRGRDLLGETSYFAFRERFILDAGGQVNEDRAFAFDAAGAPVRAGTSDFTEAVRASGGRLGGGFGEDVLYGDGASASIEGGLHDNLLYGGAGADDLSGLQGADILDGGAGDDVLRGNVGDDFYLFRPGSGRDRIQELDGIDTVFFGGGLTRADVRVVAGDWNSLRFELPATGDVLSFEGNWWVPASLERFAFSDGTQFGLTDLLVPTEAADLLVGSPGADTIDALGGDDVVSGFAGDDHLIGGAGADSLDGGEGADLLEGGEGSDQIIPGAGDDVIDGGPGDDRVDIGVDFNTGYWQSRGGGNDTFRFGFGDGADTIAEESGFDTVLFKPGVTLGDVSLTNEGANLVISLAGGADRITVVDHLNGRPIERVQFADGTVLAAADLTNATVTGTPGADTLRGYVAAKNLILGLEGDDELFGQSRADRLEGGEGDDELSGSDGNDRLMGGAGDDRLFGESERLFLLSTLSESADGGDDLLEGGDGGDLLFGGHGSDLYDGGAGDDEYVEPMQPFTYSLGADVFLFGRGDGHDRIIANESDWSYWYWLPGRIPGSQIVDDVVRLGADIAPEDVTVFAETEIVGPTERHGNIRLQVAGDEDSSLTIRDFLGGGNRVTHLWSSVRRFEFADGTVWDREDVLDRLVWQGTPGDDRIVAGQLRDRVYGEGGDDTLYGHAGDDLIDGGAGNDFIDGGAGSDTLFGGEGSDSIHTGGHGNDVIDGGAGDDRIGHWRVDRPEAFFFNAPPRLEGDVTVLYGAGSGNDRVFLPNTRPDSNDTIQVSLVPEDVKLLRREGDLLVTLPATGETLTVQHWFDGAAYRVENVRFGDGTEWDADRIASEVLIGTEESERLVGYDSDDLIEGREANDSLHGAGGADRLVGGAGDDFLDGGADADVYAYARGDGNDAIVAGGGEDALELAAGIAPGDVLVRNREGNMVLTLDSGEQITVAGQFAGYVSGLAELRFDDGTVWDEAMLRERALAGTPGDDVIEGFDTDDELSGGGGFDELQGGAGDDLYRFESGFLILSDRGGFDTLSFGLLSPDDVDYGLSDGELYIEVVATGDAVAIADFADDFSPTGNIDAFEFSDGATTLSAFQVFTLIGAGDAEVIFGTDVDDILEGSERRTIIFAGEGDDRADGEGGADELYGEAGSDVLQGGRGDDLLDGGEGGDELRGGDGDDELDGGEGDDLLDGGEGDDALYGSGGDDRLDGGEGRDRIDGESGDDTIVIGGGSDLDDVIARARADGGDVTVREGFEQAYAQGRSELSEIEGLEGEEYFYSNYWAIESDGGAAAGIPLDLLEPLLLLQGGVSADFARQALSDLDLWLTTPLRQGAEWSYNEMEYAARAAFANALDDEDGNYFNDYWAELSWNYEIPGDIFGPLVQMQEGVPAREAQVALQQLLGWLYEIVGSDEDSSRFYLFQLYGEGLVQLEEAEALLGGGGSFSSDYWAQNGDGGLVDLLPEDLRGRLIPFTDGVSPGDAIATLQDLRDYLLQRDTGGFAEEDAIEFGDDIEVDDLEIATRIDEDTGNVTELAIGIRGTNDGAIISENGYAEGNSSSVADLSLRAFRLQDGTELTLDEVLDMADGTIGVQRGTEDADTLRGSAAEDTIWGDDGDDILLGRGNDDELRGQAGSDILGAGAGDDEAHGGPGDDIVAGEKGSDALRGGPGSDVYLFNYGDGEDSIDPAFGDEGETDTLSFGADITPDMVGAVVATDGTLTLLVDEGDGGSVSMVSPVHRVQFVDANGSIRMFDLAGLVASVGAELATTGSAGTSIALFDDASAFELTASEAPAGGGNAVAYAQTGDLFAEPVYMDNEPSDGGDQLIGGAGDDAIDAGAGDDVVSGGAGDDVLLGGDGSDVLSGGVGEDFLAGGGGGDDIARGGDGDDTYLFERGDGTLAIHDNGNNTLEFGGDIEFQELRLSHSGGFLEIRFASEGDLVRIAAFEPADLFDEVAISTFYFEAEDDEYDFETLLERGFTIEGTDQADSLDGTAIHDAITAADGADFIAGGAGDDVLDGGSGGDTYFFGEGGGFDEIVDRESGLGRNTVEFGASVDPESVSVFLSGGSLFVEYGTLGDTLFTREVNLGDPERAIPFETMRFADGSTRSLVDLLNAGIAIEGSNEADSLAGATGGDTVFGLQGDDLLAGGAGADVYVVEPGSGTDTIDDVSVPGEENTLLFLRPDAGAGDLGLVYDAVAGTLDVRLEDETVKLAGFDPADPFGVRAVDFVQFASGESLTYAELLQLGIEIVGTGAAEVLRGTAARDLIYALEGDDFIQASAGGDTVHGGAGDDVYSYNRGDGVLTIVDGISTTPQNALLFGPGIALADLRNNLRFEAPAGEFPGALVVDLGGEDRVRILGFDPTNAEGGAHGIDTFAFADGTAVGYRDLVRNTFVVQGDTLDDALSGTDIGDRLYGFEGADELRSGDGPDALTGGTGDDLLVGGAGGDEYVFNRGDGIDRIRDNAGFDDNFITFGAGIAAADLSLALDGGSLRIAYGAGDEVTVEDFDRDAPAIRSLRFAGGSTLDIGAALNTAPFAAAALEDQLALEDGAFAYALPADAFDDADGGALSLSALLADGYALPAWLAFDPLTGAFSGTAKNEDVGLLTVRVLATDRYGGEAAQEFELTVLNTNDAPVVANAVADRLATEDQAFALTLPAGQFADADRGDTLTVSLTLANGDALPAWLSYDPASRLLSGTPANDHVGTLELAATATDALGAGATDGFSLRVANVNDAPAVAVAVSDQTATEDAPFSFTVPAGTFADADAGDAATTFATLASGDPLPVWLSYDPDTLTFSGTPANEDVGTASVSVTAVDTFGATVGASFDLAVANANDAPLLAAPLADAFVTEDEAFSFSVSLDAFADPDLGDTLTFSAGELPAWLSFDPSTGTFSGLATNDEVGAQLVQVVATDLSGAIGTGLFALIVLNVNDAPVAGDDTATLREDVLTTISGNLTDNDEDVDRQVDPAALLVVSPTGDIQGGHGTLTLAADGAYVYNLDNDAVQLLREDQVVFDSFEYLLSDGIVTTTAMLTVTVVGANDAPVTTADAASLGEDAVSVSGNVLTNDSDVDAGTTLIVANADSRVLTYGTLHLATNGAYAFELNAAAQSLRAGEQIEQSISYVASDGLASSDGTLTISVSGTNDVPVVANPIADQNAAAGKPFSFTFDAGTFSDIDAGDSLSYAASLADGSALPSWLSFDAATRTFTGTPPGSAGGGTAPEALDLRVTATDTAGASAQDAFVLNIAGGGGGIVPIVGTDHNDVLTGTGGNDVIDGRKGYDEMSGGAGDDVYYVDKTGGKVDLVTEEAGAGYDTVYSSAKYTLGSNLEELHLIGDDDLEGKGNSLANMLIGNSGDNRLYGEAGNDLLLDDAGEDRLDGGAGDDVMDGGAGDDTLLGGAGNDLYVHAKGGDDDVVIDSGGNDAIRFGTGIAAANVTVRRNGSDLTLKLSGGNGSVTVKDWFSSASKRVETVQFADGTAWDEAAIRARVAEDGHGHGYGDGGYGGYGGDSGNGNGYGYGNGNGYGYGKGKGHDNDDDGWNGRHGGRRDRKDQHHGGGDGGSDDYRDALAQRLKRDPNYDFTALAQYLQKNGGGGYGAMSPREIAQRWLQVQNSVASLAPMDGHDGGEGQGGGHHDGGGWGGGDGHSRRGWGYAGSTGEHGAYGGMDGFSGLGEGFRKL
ncbi:MAG: putative Ig domain-containing protein [Burkholderiales bacterium]